DHVRGPGSSMNVLMTKDANVTTRLITVIANETRVRRTTMCSSCVVGEWDGGDTESVPVGARTKRDRLVGEGGFGPLGFGPAVLEGGIEVPRGPVRQTPITCSRRKRPPSRP